MTSDLAGPAAATGRAALTSPPWWPPADAWTHAVAGTDAPENPGTRSFGT